MAHVSVLIPTRDRPAALATTLTSLAMQSYRDFSVHIANQGDPVSLGKQPSLCCALRLLNLHDNHVVVRDNLPPRGMAEQRAYLFRHAVGQYCLFLDDDVLLEPYVLGMLVNVLAQQQCGFVGNATIGLSHLSDVRPNENIVELWPARVEPENITPGTPAWQRYTAHNAANILHTQQRIGASPGAPMAYKIAWVGGCVLYDCAKLRAVGGFDFWNELPPNHAGEDVLAQLRVMKRFGGCGVMPSGAYHQELPTTLADRKIDAPLCLPI